MIKLKKKKKEIGELEEDKKGNEKVSEEDAEAEAEAPHNSEEEKGEDLEKKIIELTLEIASLRDELESRKAESEKLFKLINDMNAARSSGAIQNDGKGIYFSPSEVRQMSGAEVKKNYGLIIESMKKWN